MRRFVSISRRGRAAVRPAAGRLAFLLGCAFPVLLASCRSGGEPEARPAEAAYRNHDPAVAYVGREACRDCHAGIYETFVRSEMGRSFKPARLSASAADFRNAGPVYDPATDLYYLPFSRGEELFLMEYRLSGRDTVHRRVERIDYIVGSGQHTNSHMMQVNGYLYQMPLTWYAQDRKWDLPPKFDRGNNTRFERPIPLECMACHNDVPQYLEGSESRYARLPDGIGCERCHGPGALHVEEKRAGKIVDVSREIDYTIVNPGKLPVDRQFDVCQRCHMQGASVYREGRTPLDFRPGQRLADHFDVFWPRYPDSTSQFIMASHPDRLRMSACFRETRAGARTPMTCITCHDPHVSVKEQGPAHFNAVCQSCHTPPEQVPCAAPPAVRAQEPKGCIGCHMPESGTMDIPHVRITDHYIREPAEIRPWRRLTAEENVARPLVRLASLIRPDPLPQETAEGFLTYFETITNAPYMLDSAAVHLGRARGAAPPERLTPSLVRLHFLRRDHDEVIRLARTMEPARVGDAWTAYRIGEAHLQRGAFRPAVLWLERSLALSPGHLRFMARLASAYSEGGEQQRALEAYDRLLAAQPKQDEALNNRGFVKVLLRDFDGAEADFKASLALNPDAEQALGNLASLYLNTNRKREARPFAERLVELHPENEAYRQFLSLLE